MVWTKDARAFSQANPWRQSNAINYILVKCAHRQLSDSPETDIATLRRCIDCQLKTASISVTFFLPHKFIASFARFKLSNFVGLFPKFLCTLRETQLFSNFPIWVFKFVRTQLWTQLPNYKLLPSWFTQQNTRFVLFPIELLKPSNWRDSKDSIFILDSISYISLLRDSLY